MKNFILYVVVALVLLATKLTAQETFPERAKEIVRKIERITKEEKEALKEEIEAVNKQLENGAITKEQAELKKKELAEAKAIVIESKVNAAKEEFGTLVQQKVDGKIKGSIDNEFILDLDWHDKEKDSIKGESRHTSQLVVAFGPNNLITNGAVANSDFKYMRSGFSEIGLTRNTRVFKQNNLLHLKYGFSFVYNQLRATDNRYFVVNGEQTNLATYPVPLKQNKSFFRNTFITIPLHLEFDFTKTKIDKDGKKIYRSHHGLRTGFGGFVGYNLNSKQFLGHDLEGGYKLEQKVKGNWNVPDWNYGLSAYLGYGETSLYLKYDINPMFKNNVLDQNNISLGIRFDFN